MRAAYLAGASSLGAFIGDLMAGDLPLQQTEKTIGNSENHRKMVVSWDFMVVFHGIDMD